MITLSDGSTVLELPYDLNWIDRAEFPISQSVTRSVTGALIIMTAAGQYGREITLEPPRSGGWWLAENEAQILTWLAIPEKRLTLDVRGDIHAVMFRQSDARAYESTPVFYSANPGPDHYIIPTFRFLTVEPD